MFVRVSVTIHSSATQVLTLFASLHICKFVTHFHPIFSSFLPQHPVETYGYGFLLSVTGYLGIQVVLQLVRTAGATTAVTVTTFRKALSIAVSFIFFTKPFTWQYVWSGLIIVIGIYLNVYSKKSKMTFAEFTGRIVRLFGRHKIDDASRQKLLNV